MDPIAVPRPKSIRDPNRAASSLLLAQVHHLREAEKNLPWTYHSKIFHKGIQTEGEAARYVKAVTEAIHRAHDDAAAERARRAARPEGVIEIAAEADEAAERENGHDQEKQRDVPDRIARALERIADRLDQE